MEHADTHGRNQLRRLLHRWLVQYNPLYLVSATLCLAGMHLTSRGLAAQESLFGALSVEAITEAYALALIGGAALLTRLGQRRPAVMLVLLAALYQGDLALYTEACTCLHTAGIAASMAWIALFVAKLYAMAWAVKVRPSWSAVGLAAYGGIGLALIPQLLLRMNEGSANALVALWVFSVAALGLNVSRSVASAVGLDDWGRTVLRRALRAVWLMWALAIVGHVVFWSQSLSVNLIALVPAAVLIATRFLRSESRVWAAVAATLVIVARIQPQLFSLCAVMAAATLVMRAYRHLQRRVALPGASMASPFRGSDGEPAEAIAVVEWVFAPASTSARRRLLAGALFASYLALWTVGWSGGPWPLHSLPLDLTLTAIVVLLAAKGRMRIALPPLAISYAHLLVQAHVVTAPHTTLEWGALSTGVAFALLIASLAASYWLRDVESLHPGGDERDRLVDDAAAALSTRTPVRTRT
jgi:hypothetical protein